MSFLRGVPLLDVLAPPEMPSIPAPAPIVPAEPASPGTKASESSGAQDARQKIVASLGRKKTRTLLTGAQGLSDMVSGGKKTLLGE